MYGAMASPADARQILQGELRTARVDRLHVVNVEQVTVGTATGTPPTVAAQRRMARTTRRLRSVEARRTWVIHLLPHPRHRRNGAGALAITMAARGSEGTASATGGQPDAPPQTAPVEATSATASSTQTVPISVTSPQPDRRVGGVLAVRCGRIRPAT